MPVVDTELVLNSDGSFEILGVPRQVFSLYKDAYWNQPLDWKHTVDLHGSWKIYRGVEAVDPMIQIDIAAGAGSTGLTTFLDLGNGRSGPTLSSSYGDPDESNRFAFTKSMSEAE